MVFFGLPFQVGQRQFFDQCDEADAVHEELEIAEQVADLGHGVFQRKEKISLRRLGQTPLRDPTSTAKIPGGVEAVGSREKLDPTTTIGALLHHPKLFAADPFLKTFPVAIDDDPQSIGDGRRMIAAYYHGERSALVVGSDPPNSRKHGVFRTCNNLQLAIFIVGSQLHVAIPRAFRRLGQPPPTAFPPQCSHIECSTRTPAPPANPRQH